MSDRDIPARLWSNSIRPRERVVMKREWDLVRARQQSDCRDTWGTVRVQLIIAVFAQFEW